MANSCKPFEDNVLALKSCFSCFWSNSVHATQQMVDHAGLQGNVFGQIEDLTNNDAKQLSIVKPLKMKFLPKETKSIKPEELTIKHTGPLGYPLRNRRFLAGKTWENHQTLEGDAINSATSSTCDISGTS